MGKANTNTKTKALTIKAENIISKAQFQDFCKNVINLQTDFAVFKTSRASALYQVEPKRDLALKIIAYFGYSYDTELTNIIELKGELIRYVVKAKVWKGDRQATGLGLATNKEKASGTPGREDHDAIGRAETRALKRAVEGLSGLPIINQLIEHYFNGYKIRPEKLKELGLSASLS